MKIAFYIAKKGRLLDKLIAWWTRPDWWRFWESGKFSHTELVFSDGWCFSASPREGSCRWKKIKFDESKWVFIELDKIYDETEIALRCSEENGKSYDYVGIFWSFIIPIGYETKRKWFCSEIAAKLALEINHANRYSPNDLYDLLT